MLIVGAGVYVAALLLLAVTQSAFIYPAPQTRHAAPPGFAEVTLATEDGLELLAHWRAADAGRDTVVWFHGNGGSLAGAASETRSLRREGYGLLLVSYRGYGGNAGNPSEAGFYEDGRAAMRWLAARGIALDDTVVAGNSIGSGTATQMAIEFGSAGLILISPFVSLVEAASERMPIFPVSLLLRDRFDNIGKLPALDMPVLILHGTTDRVVPFSHGERLAKAGRNVTFKRYDGMGHDMSFRDAAQRAQLEWLETLGGP
nr:alpha/beta hydrolase [Erythrobacter ani]